MPYRTSLKQGGASAYILAHNTGKDRQTIFRSPADYQHFMVLVKQLIRTNDSISLLGFTLLQDSFYLLIHEERRGAAAKIIQRLSIAYGIYFNSKYLKTGKVFRGPYKDTVLVSDDEIMRALCQIHRLPIHQSENIELYKWSSYHYYLKRQGAWLDKTFVKNYFAIPTYANDLRHMTAVTSANDNS